MNNDNLPTGALTEAEWIQLTDAQKEGYREVWEWYDKFEYEWRLPSKNNFQDYATFSKWYLSRIESCGDTRQYYLPITTATTETENSKDFQTAKNELSSKTCQFPATTDGETEQKHSDCIIITHSEHQVRALHLAYRKVFKNEGFWGQKQMDYSKEWHWLLKGRELSGSSGYNSLEYKVEQNPDLPVFTFLQWDKLHDPYDQPTTPPQQVERETVDQAAQSDYDSLNINHPGIAYHHKKAFIRGVKWQAHRSATEIAEYKAEIERHERIQENLQHVEYDLNRLRSENEMLRQSLSDIYQTTLSGYASKRAIIQAQINKALKTDQP